MLIGEGPSYEEDRQKEPFVGKTGIELRGVYLPILGIPASDIFITNASLCSRKGYVNPTHEEAMACASVHLGQQMMEVRPEIVVPMGAVACSLFPEITSLSLQHGRPILGRWGAHTFTLFPMYHPSSGLRASGFMIAMMQDMEDLRKLLLTIDQGEFEWPMDPHPEPDYQFIRTEKDLREYMHLSRFEVNLAWVSGHRPLGEDTESLPGGLGKMGGGPPFCLTFSHTPGTGRLIYVRDRHLIDAYRKMLYELLPLQLFHNYLHDATVFDALSLLTEPFLDTMVRAYNLCLGGGGDDEDGGESRAGRGSLSLKALAYRHCNMVMTSFYDTVYPHSIPPFVTWLKQGLEVFAPDSDRPPRCECGCLQMWHEPRGKTGNATGPCLNCNQCPKWRTIHRVKHSGDKVLDLLYRKVNGLVKDVESGKRGKNGETVDPWDRFMGWPEYDQNTLIETLGPVPLASIEHVPEDALLNYAIRDADATLRIYKHMQNLHPWIFYT